MNPVLIYVVAVDVGPIQWAAIGRFLPIVWCGWRLEEDCLWDAWR